MNVEQAEQNCIKAATKWANDIKLRQPDAEGHEPRFWTEQFRLLWTQLSPRGPGSSRYSVIPRERWLRLL